jgi:hypothetical protein
VNRFAPTARFVADATARSISTSPQGHALAPAFASPSNRHGANRVSALRGGGSYPALTQRWHLTRRRLLAGDSHLAPSIAVGPGTGRSSVLRLGNLDMEIATHGEGADFVYVDLASQDRSEPSRRHAAEMRKRPSHKVLRSLGERGGASDDRSREVKVRKERLPPCAKSGRSWPGPPAMSLHRDRSRNLELGWWWVPSSSARRPRAKGGSE